MGCYTGDAVGFKHRVSSWSYEDLATPSLGLKFPVSTCAICHSSLAPAT
jgi:hypothetical protein